MNKKYALRTIENLLNQAKFFFDAGRVDDAIQLINSATLILEANEIGSKEFDSKLNDIHILASHIIEVSTARFSADLWRKFNF